MLHNITYRKLHGMLLFRTCDFSNDKFNMMYPACQTNRMHRI